MPSSLFQQQEKPSLKDVVMDMVKGKDPKQINFTGTYEAEFDAVVSATTAGLVTLQIYLDGVALPETARTVTASVGNTAISTGTIRNITSPCGSTPNIQLYASTDGTAVGSVILVSGRIKKL